MACPIKVAAMEPPMPRMAVSQKPPGPAPGVYIFAIMPAANPIRIVQTQCIMLIILVVVSFQNYCKVKATAYPPCLNVR